MSTTSERIRHEAREIGLTTLYFLGWFLLFLTLKKLLLAEYRIEIGVVHTAVIGALVVAKVVVLLDKTSYGDRMRSGTVFAHVVWRSLCYTAIVSLVSFAERVFDLYRESSGLSSMAARLWEDGNLDHVLAFNLCVAMSFLVYNSLLEIDRHLGDGALRRLFFSR